MDGEKMNKRIYEECFVDPMTNRKKIRYLEGMIDSLMKRVHELEMKNDVRERMEREF